MFIAVDAMGGDFAPRAVVEGAARAASEGIGVFLVGDRRVIERELDLLGLDPHGTPHLLIEHAEQVVAMEERAIAVAKKRQASMRVCARLVKEGRAQAMVKMRREFQGLYLELFRLIQSRSAPPAN